MKVVGWSDSSGSCFWRMRIPLGAITKHTDWQCYVSPNGMNEPEMLNADTIILHNIVNKEGIATLLAIRHEHPEKKIIVDVDDALFVAEDNPHKKDWEVLDAAFVISQTIKQADAVTCSTEALKAILTPLNPHVFILPNYYDPEWLKGTSLPIQSSEIRVGWAGSITHKNDLEMITPVLDTIMERYPVKFIVCGDPRIKSMMKYSERVEMVPPVPIEYWPQRLASMSLDIGIAPLAETPFNSYKSPIKWIEYSRLGIPSVCSEGVYTGYATYTASTHEQWVQYVSELIEHKDQRERIGLIEQRKAEYYDITKHYTDWMEVYE